MAPKKRLAPAAAAAEPPNKRSRPKRGQALNSESPTPDTRDPALLAAMLDGLSARMDEMNSDRAAEPAVNSSNRPLSPRLADCILFSEAGVDHDSRRPSTGYGHSQGSPAQFSLTSWPRNTF